MYLGNHDIPRERKVRPKNEKGEELIKNQECATCQKMYECKGKPRSTKQCLNYISRKIVI